ncbi:hypothetical protein PFICI_12414 [Pestalotiopsis fici W106-1]|uniref:Tyrosinase copper-binding domain-containing protein n=1 Tax=Pestalotiopsis fici (strain W106-1 / CGMCC3.15140) TaxID=1229662 RepID=W3WNI1_PESFW|nr:uncharacterized protein PFICI_12414 [Pestalotiopsis fici W106-1]ETS75470.1 hypothetical protein PFICI_12414 [Pestalotiopsis fici W106-1]
MASLARTIPALLALAATAIATPVSTPVKRDSCSTYRTVKDWNDLTSDEQSDYLAAEVCLTEYAATMDLGGSKTYWDELMYNHITQVDYIHFVGQFLPWHRYFVSVHANALRDYCGYEGPLAYWNEQEDASTLTDIEDSTIFQSDAFGGNGVGDDECIANGPFANVTLTFTPGESPFGGNATADDTCIFRDLSLSTLQSSDFDECLEEDNFEDMWDCVENGPHANGHGAVGGLMGNVANSPGDPVFWLHHAFIDLQWWKWQSQDLDTRLTEIGGTNGRSSGDEPADIAAYDGDNGNTTTLTHNLWMMDLYPNVTVADVMSINYTDVCLDYVY